MEHILHYVSTKFSDVNILTFGHVISGVIFKVFGPLNVGSFNIDSRESYCDLNCFCRYCETVSGTFC